MIDGVVLDEEHRHDHDWIVSHVGQHDNVSLIVERPVYEIHHHNGDLGRKFEVQVVREHQHDTVGFNVAALDDGHHWVHSVNPGSIAEGAGIKAGDQVVSINQLPLDGRSHGEVLQLIRQFLTSTYELARYTNAPQRVHSWVDAREVPTGEQQEITLTREGDASFGFSVATDEGSHYHEVTGVVAGSVSAGKLKPHDYVEILNGSSTQGMSHTDVIE